MKRLKTSYKGMDLWLAGLPGFQSLFVRDGLEAGMLAGLHEMLRNFITYSTFYQGTKYDPSTGEEPGKHPHERNPLTHTGVELEGKPGLTTEYNACDTTALWLIALNEYTKLTGDLSLLKKFKNAALSSVEYIQTHLSEDNLFFEDPRLTGASEFALNVTYWKDSVVPGRRGGKPHYPVVYTLAHVQNLAGLRAARKLLKTRKLDYPISEMAKNLDLLWDKKAGTFDIALDSAGPIRGISSDSLHALYYLEPGDISPKKIEQVVDASRALETAAGYRTLASRFATMNDGYHTRTIWPYEQAKINSGARKHRLWTEKNDLHSLGKKLRHVEGVSRRVLSQLNGNNNETLVIGRGRKVTRGGNDPQLWTIAAKQYFAAASN